MTKNWLSIVTFSRVLLLGFTFALISCRHASETAKVSRSENSFEGAFIATVSGEEALETYQVLDSVLKQKGIRAMAESSVGVFPSRFQNLMRLLP